MLFRLPYLAWWYIRSLFGRKTPLQSVIFILDQCNLRCKHCSVYAIATPRIKTYAQIREELLYCYNAGSRFVDFEGGELYLWKDGAYRIDDVIDLAHEIGFWSATITTNAQISFVGSHADQIWVSMDGVGAVHDNIRGEGVFHRLERHIAEYRQQGGRKPLGVNMVINNSNVHDVVNALEYVRKSPYIDSISLNFHTPFEETKDLFLDPDCRNETIDTLIAYKQKGYPIMNTIPGLKAMKTVNGATRCGNNYCWITNFIFSDGSRAPKCMGYVHHVCDRCGFAMGGEMFALYHLDPRTIMAGLKLRTK